MEGGNQESHRPGALKQQNKTHKTGGHRSKGAIHKVQKGKVNVKTITKRTRGELRKVDRRHQAVQIRKNKRDATMTKKRSLGGTHNAPFLVAVVAICEDIDPNGAIELLKQADSESVVKNTTQGTVHISLPRFKQRFALVSPRVGNLNATLDTLKVADTVLFLTSVSTVEEGLGEVGEAIMTAALAQRLPTPILAVIDLDTVPIKRRNETKQAVQDVVSRWLPGEKVAALGSTSEALAILRRVGSQKRRVLAQRDRRAHLMAEHVELTPDQTSETGTLKAEGFVRGQPLSPNLLVHIPGFGQFRVSLIELLSDPTVTGHSTLIGQIEPSPEKQESLEAENPVDAMDAEQTWPTEQDHLEAATERKTRRVRVPKGMSEYQAAWIPEEMLEGVDEEDVEQDSDSEADDNGEIPMDEGGSDLDSASDSAHEDEDEMSLAEEPEADRYDEKTDVNEERAARAKLAAAREDAQFPDEVDTPAEIPARVRFQKYRGLQSFRTSTWDPKENLPADYARIFQFQNYERMRKRAFRSEDKEGAPIGSYVRVHLANVPVALFSEWRIQSIPLPLISMPPHEQRMTLLNLAIRNNTDQPIKSKEELIFHVGYRRFKARPIFSQHSNGNKHKYERFWQPGAMAVASVFAPVMFAPASVLVFSEQDDGTQLLVGTGSVLSADPGRVAVKRVVLSGHPLKVLKRSAVVRFMFFNREDILWFKPVELVTRLGRRGHIKEPLGTHGHMKCVFDSQLKSQDAIFMRLYKRVFPPWTYENLTSFPPALC